MVTLTGGWEGQGRSTKSAGPSESRRGVGHGRRGASGVPGIVYHWHPLSSRSLSKDRVSVNM